MILSSLWRHCDIIMTPSIVITFAVVQAADGVVVGGGPALVEGGACVTEGGVGGVAKGQTGIPGVGVVRLLDLH